MGQRNVLIKCLKDKFLFLFHLPICLLFFQHGRYWEMFKLVGMLQQRRIIN